MQTPCAGTRISSHKPLCSVFYRARALKRPQFSQRACNNNCLSLNGSFRQQTGRQPRVRPQTASWRRPSPSTAPPAAPLCLLDVEVEVQASVRLRSMATRDVLISDILLIVP